ncbi:MAG: molybdopterin-dependent oxidoreductase [Egibacteraceae bacterium]
MAELDEAGYEQARQEERVWRAAGLSRRHFLERTGAAVAGTALGACATTRKTEQDSPFVKAVTEDRFIRHETNAEMRWDQMASQDYVVDNGLFFVRDHTSTPRIDPATWRLVVSGSGVARTLELTYDELLALPAVTSATRSVECAGNGRTFFKEAQDQEVEGTQWRLGAIGVAEWTGVPLGEVLERAGLGPAARDVMPTGLDELKVRRPIPVAKALQDDTLLVFAMNGEPLPADHGFPVRLLVPGWIGIASIKWLGHIEVSNEPLFSDWNTGSYVLIGPTYQPEGRHQGPLLTSQVVKSALELAWPASLAAGQHTIRGRSWSGQGRIAKVEYRLDDGREWRPAQLHEPNIPLAWARWSFAWDARPGEHSIRIKATDDRGNTQPDTVEFNEMGYLYNAVVAHPVNVA